MLRLDDFAISDAEHGGEALQGQARGIHELRAAAVTHARCRRTRGLGIGTSRACLLRCSAASCSCSSCSRNSFSIAEAVSCTVAVVVDKSLLVRPYLAAMPDIEPKEGCMATLALSSSACCSVGSKTRKKQRAEGAGALCTRLLHALEQRLRVRCDHLAQRQRQRQRGALSAAAA